MEIISGHSFAIVDKIAPGGGEERALFLRHLICTRGKQNVLQPQMNPKLTLFNFPSFSFVFYYKKVRNWRKWKSRDKN